MTSVPTTDQGKRAWLLEGKPLAFNPCPKDREETLEEKAGRTIKASWIEDLVDGPGRVIRKNLLLINALIEGPLDLTYAVVQGSFQLIRCALTGNVRCTSAVFERSALFVECTFADTVDFRAAIFHGDLMLPQTTFVKGSDFADLHVEGHLLASGSSFGKTTFDGAHIEGNAFFRSCLDSGGFQQTTFREGIRFIAGLIEGDADFHGVIFDGEASFVRTRVHGCAFFNCVSDAGKLRPSIFHGKVEFRRMHVGRSAEFEGAQFEGAADFANFRVGNDLYFRPPTEAADLFVLFKQAADFAGAVVEGTAEFDAVRFAGAAHFDGMRFRGNVYFRPRNQLPRFEGPAYFSSAVFEAYVDFTFVEFESDTHFDSSQFLGSANFHGARFAIGHSTSFAGTYFRRGFSFEHAIFGGPTDFACAVVEGEASFRGALFQSRASFHEAAFRSLCFRDRNTWLPNSRAPGKRAPAPGKQFAAPLDLTGLTYERIYVDVYELLRWIRPYERQPFALLEFAMRGMGNDRVADDVYLERRRVERKTKWQSKQYMGWLLDVIYVVVANFGIRPFRLLVFTIAFLALGVGIFQTPGAVTNRDPSERINDPVKLSLRQAIGVSIHEFLPVDVPSGSQWVPTTRAIPASGRARIAYSTYATIHRLAGWLLVPLGIAALSGLLHRRADLLRKKGP